MSAVDRLRTYLSDERHSYSGPRHRRRSSALADLADLERELADRIDFLAGSSLCEGCQVKRGERRIIATPRIQVEEDRDRLLSAAIHFLHEGCTCPEKYEKDYGERTRIVWNEKIDRLQAAIDATRRK